MILPGSYAYSVVLLIVSLLCWGCWANTWKMAGKWRYELYYFDFAIGLSLASLIAGLTVGSMGWDGFSFLDDVRNAGKRQELFAFLGGAVFNLANMLLLASASLAGISVAFPVCMGIALIVGVIWLYIGAGGSLLLLGFGCAAVAVAVVLTSTAYRRVAPSRNKQTAPLSPVKGKAPKKIPSSRALLLAVAGGLLMGSYSQLLDMARVTENGLGPYSLVFIFSLGVFATTFVYGLFLMNLPVQGEPVEFGAYFTSKVKQHGLGILGGMLWACGAIASFVAARTEGAAHPGAAISYLTAQGGTILTALFGLVLWKEFSQADVKDKTYMFIMLVLFAAGLAAVSISPLFAPGT